MSVIIPINDQYRIELDNYYWIVAVWQTDSNQPDGGRWVSDTYHKTLQLACESLLLRFVSECDISGAQEIIEALRTTSTLIARAILESGFSRLENRI